MVNGCTVYSKELTRVPVHLPGVGKGVDVVCLTESPHMKGVSLELVISKVKVGNVTDVLVLKQTEIDNFLRKGYYLGELHIHENNYTRTYRIFID